MKLRNKKTGGLANIMGEQNFFRVYTDAGWADYKSLAELNEEWEDYKPDTGEKLKAWKRLKDKGFRFDGVEVFSKGLIEIDAVLPALEEVDHAERCKIIDDLALLFGEEEE